MTERIGLTAVLELGAFSRAVQTYNQAVSGMSKNTASTASSISSSFVGLGSGILKVGAIAAGAGLAGVAALTAGLVLLGSTALTEFAKYERMALSIQSLVARDLAQGQLVEQQRTVAISLTKKEAQELDGLAGKIHDEELARNTLHARIKEQSEALRQLREAHGEEALDVQTATARLAELENQYNKSGAEIQTLKDRQVELTNKTGEYVTVIDKVRTGQMSMTEAMAQAGPKAAELLNWVSKLAIQSPFTEEGVNLAFQTALAYGFNIDEAKRLTEAEVDYAAATGKGVETTNLIALALGQMQAKGKVSGQEIIQLTNAGVGVNKILEDMGFTLDDVSNGLVDADTFIEAVIKDMEIFEGAAANQANTFSGLISTLSDLKAIGLREFFTGTFTAIQPYLAEFVGFLTNAALETGSIRELGDAFGTYVADGIAKVVEVVTNLSSAFSKFGVRGAAVSLMGMLGFSQEDIGLVSGIIRTVTDEVARLQEVFQKFGASGVAFSIGGLLGLDSDTMVLIQQTLTTITTTITNFAEKVKPLLAEIGFEELKGALLGIGAVVATGIFSALVAGILSLLTPINLIIAGAALLGAAWAGNWFGIRDTLTNAWNTIYPILTDLWEWLSTNIPAAVQAVSDIWNNTLKPGFTEVANAVTSQVLPALQNLWDTLTQGTGGTQTLSDLWTNTLQPALKAVGDFVVNTLFPAWVDLEVFLAGALATAITALADYWENWLFPAMGKVKDAIGVMSDLWTNTLKPALVTVGNYINDNIVPLLESIGELFNAVLNKALEASAGLWKNVLYPALTKVGNFIKDTLSPVLELVSETAKDKLSPILKELGETIFPILQEGLDYVTEAIKDLISFFDSLTDKVKSFDLPPILKPGSPPPMAYALMDIAKGADMATGAITAMGKATDAISGATLNSLMTGMKVTDSGFVDRFIDELDMGGIAKAAGAGGGRWKDIRSIIHQTIRANMGVLEQGGDAGTIIGLIQKQAEKFHLPPSIAVEFAKLNGLVEHLNSTFGAMFQKLRIENLGQSIGVAGQFAGIGSGLADIIKEQAGSGEEVVKTIEAQQKLTAEAEEQAAQLAILQRELDELTTSEGVNQIAVDKKRLAIERATESLGFSERQLAIYRQELATLMQDEAGNALQIEKKTLQIDKQVEAIDAQQKQLVTLQQELEKLTATNELDTASIEKKRKAITDLTKAMAQNQEAITKSEAELRKLANTPAGRLEFFKAFLEGKIKGTDIQGPFGVMKDMLEFEQDGLKVALNRTLVQQEYNRLLEQQKKEQEEIARLEKAQKDLNFLQQQISLLKLISDRGLNPRDIIGGITLGLNASATDLLKVTNNIVQAMVDQINKDLQIGSPSRLMINTFKQVMAGAAIGMERGQSLLSNAVRSIPILNGNIPQPIFNQAGGVSSSVSNTYNYNFPMTVQTAATAPAVVRQYEIKRSMYAN